MSVIVTVFYPLWYSSHRAQIKDIVDAGQNVIAKNELQVLIQEHSIWLTELGNPKDGVYGEQIAMEHALRHLNAVIDKNDPEFYYSDGVTIGHQSDIVKSALLHVPKPDYSVHE